MRWGWDPEKQAVSTEHAWPYSIPEGRIGVYDPAQ